MIFVNNLNREWTSHSYKLIHMKSANDIKKRIPFLYIACQRGCNIVIPGVECTKDGLVTLQTSVNKPAVE